MIPVEKKHAAAVGRAVRLGGGCAHVAWIGDGVLVVPGMYDGGGQTNLALAKAGYIYSAHRGTKFDPAHLVVTHRKSTGTSHR